LQTADRQRCSGLVYVQYCSLVYLVVGYSTVQYYQVVQVLYCTVLYSVQCVLLFYVC